MEKIKQLEEAKNQRDPLDALREWYRIVPEDLRRIEYEYYKYFRTRKMMQKFQALHKETHGKFSIIPDYTQKQEDEDWQSFKESFLRSPQKKKTLLEMLNSCKKDIPRIRERIREDLLDLISIKRLREPQAIVVGGSAVIGPRDVTVDPSSDIDLYVVMKDESFTRGLPHDWQVIDLSQKETGVKYQIMYVGESAANIPSFTPIHILAQPHIVLDSLYEDDVLETMTQKIVKDSAASLPVLTTKLRLLENELERKKETTILE